MKIKVVLVMYLLYFGSTGSSAQNAEPFFTKDSETNTEVLRETLREARIAARDGPRVKPAVLSSDDIDSLILQKMYYSLQADPDSFQASTGFSDTEVDELTANLKDFTDVVLQQQQFSLDDMCKVWNSSSLEIETLIDETLAAFDTSQSNRSPITFQVMRKLLTEIESEVGAEQFRKFSEILNVTRRELAGQPVYTFAQNARIMGDAEATLKYHCEEVR
jgi:hypothetical protein